MVSLTVFAADQTYSFPQSARFILPSAAAKNIFRQCSRAAPSAKSELWQPSVKDLDELEHALPLYLEALEKSGKTVPPKTTYRRQYAGFIKDGERYIYGNFYPPDRGVIGYESRQAVQVCDGGHVFWGIVYRSGTKTFEEPEFNGFA